MISSNDDHLPTIIWGQSMVAASDRLWRINNEYRLRLTRAQNQIDLLIQLIQVRVGDSAEALLGALVEARVQVAGMAEEHRVWRYRYYYDNAAERRMVQDERSVQRALANFGRMQTGHQRLLNALAQHLSTFSRPPSHITVVPNGDLWDLTGQALLSLADFEAYWQTSVH